MPNIGDITQSRDYYYNKQSHAIAADVYFCVYWYRRSRDERLLRATRYIITILLLHTYKIIDASIFSKKLCEKCK